nr:TonB-dependent receptor plug domain-containing protein [Ignavibacteria bacterium]
MYSSSKISSVRSALVFFSRVLCIIIFACGITLSEEDNTGRISGSVIDNSNEGIISYTKIKLEQQDGGKFKAETNSDLVGKFEFKAVPFGTYRIYTIRLGYEREEITDIIVDSKETKKVNIFLTPVVIETEKINVTATKTELTLKQTPSSISILNSEDIKNRNPLTFDDVLSDIQGVTVFKTSGINVQSLSIRGSSDVAGGGIGNRVLLLLDGRPSLTGDSKGALWSLIPVSIIERTEVVKGAFSSLYGSSAIGGVVNVITKKPTYKSFTSINTNFGFYEKLNDS